MRLPLFNTSKSMRFLITLNATTLLAVAIGACTTPLQPASIFSETVWDVAANHAITAELLVERIRAVDILLLGETHDNPNHHRLQNALLTALSNRGRTPALVMEQFDFEQQPIIDTAMARATSHADGLALLQKTMASGWEWPQYAALIDTAKERHLPLRAANLSRSRLQQVSRQGFAALGSGEATRLALDTGWSDAQQAQLEKDIVDGHCGMLPAKAAAAVARAQRARDAMMADALLNVSSDTAVAIFGREHVRRDIAVPLYLASRAPHRKTVVIGFIDSDGSQLPQEVATGTLGRRFDYVVLTAPVQRKVDPCEGLVMPAAMPK